jgi:uncharacterized protein with beta-barrel porin domain
MTFAAGGAPFMITGVPLAENVLVVDAGLGVTFAPDATFGVTYRHASAVAFGLRAR